MHDDVLNYLAECRDNRELAALARELDIPYITLKKILDGGIANPGIKYLQRIYDYSLS